MTKPMRRHHYTTGNENRIAGAAAGLLLACAGLLAAALPAEAQTTYISNTGQTYDPDFSYLVGPDHIGGQYSYAQQFTTGKEPGGYALGSVELYLRHVGRMDVPKVSIYTVTSDDPGRSVYVLTNTRAGEYVHNSLVTFTAPPRATLAPNTPYFVVVEAVDGAFGVGGTDALSEDAGSAGDWSLRGARHWRNTDAGNWFATTPPLRIAVKGLGPNTAATGQPSISGAPRVGTILVAGLGTIADVDGLPWTFPDDYTFQWVRVDGGTETDLSGETSHTYTLGTADLGKTIKVRVSFADAREKAEGPLESDATGPVTEAREIPGDEILDATLTVGRNGYGCGREGDNQCGAQMSQHAFSSTDALGVSRRFTITALGIDATQQQLWFQVSTQLSDYEKHNLVLVLGGWRFAFRTANSQASSSLFKFWNDAGLSWAAGQQVQVQIVDADNPPSTPRVPSVRVADAEAHEADGTIDFKVTVNRPLQGDRPLLHTVTVDYATSDGSAKAGEDYEQKYGTLTFPRDETEQTVSVRLIDDAVEDDGETFTLTLSDAKRATIADQYATGTIRNSEDPGLSVADASATEGSAVVFTVSLSRSNSEPVTVAYATSGGTATSGIDFTAASGTLTFAANEMSKTVSVETTDDSAGEEDETFTLTLSSPTNATLTDASATGTINNDDGEVVPLTAEFQNVPATHDGSTAFTLRVLFSEALAPGGSGRKLARGLALTGATAGTVRRVDERRDLYEFPVRPSGTTAVTVSLSATTDCAADDALCTAEGKALSQAVSATVAGQTVTPELSVADASAAEGSAVAFTVSLSEASSDSVTVAYATSGGTATSGTDFTAASGTLTFAANETSKTVSVVTTDDSDDEENETFTLTLSSPTNATLGDSTATGTINDDDGEVVPLTAEFQNVPAAHDGSTAFTLRVLFSEDLAPGGSGRKLARALALTGATAGTVRRVNERRDLYEFPLRPSGTTAVTVSLSATTDCAADDALCTADGKALSQAVSVTVAGPAATPAVSVADASATEGSAVAFTVSLSEASSDQVTVAYATSGGTATSGTDFTAASGTLTFAANETSKTVSVATTDDSSDEENETFTLTLSSPTNATLGDSTATGTIEDDDATPLTASFSDVPASHDGSSAFTFTLSFSENVAGLSFRKLRDSAFDVTGGSVKAARRKTEGSDQHWNIEVEPDSEADVVILLPETTDCSATGAICTSDGRKLSQAVSATVAGPDVTAALTARFEDMPASHTGADFTFGLVLSEDIGGLGFRTLRDDAFDVTGGSVRNARRQEQGSNQRWTITVRPSSASDTVNITLPETTDCNATGAICTDDDRPLSHSLSATVLDAASSSSVAGDAAAGPVGDGGVDAALALAAGLTPDDATAALFGERSLTDAQEAALDRLGNRNGSFDLGDVLSWIERCRRGEADCGGASGDAGPLGAAALLAAARRRRTSGRRGGRAPGPRGRTRARRARRRAGIARYAVVVLLAAVTTWSCADGVVGPVAPDAAVPDPGFLTVELAAPAAHRVSGVLLEIEGPGIGVVQARGLELYESAASGRHQVILAGTLESGPLMQFRVPDRNRLAQYRVRVIQVTGEDYGLMDAGRYRAVLRH